VSPAWRTVGASVPGPSHLAKNIPCQDAHEYRDLGPDGMLMVVSDGAGSARLSDRGSSACCRAVAEFLAERHADLGILDPADLQDALTAARQELEKLAATEPAAVREFACTALILALFPSRVICAHLGDGAIVLQLADRKYLALSLPQKGDYANETCFLTDSGFLAETRLRELETPIPVIGAAVFSDGIERLTLDLTSGEPFPPFFDPMFDHVRQTTDLDQLRNDLSVYLSSERLAQKSDDDKTLVLAANLQASLNPA
jgi:hypothetical protein